MRTVDETGRIRRVQLLAPLAHRDFRILWLGMSTSLLGDGVLLVALAWQAYTLTGSPSGMSAVGVALAVPQLALVLLGGVASDRLDRRAVMVASDLVRGACLTVLAALAVTGELRLWQLIAVAAVYGGASGFFPPAFEAIVPSLVPADQLVEANALDQFVRTATLQIGGTAVGGLLIAVAGTGGAFAFDALTFAVSIGCVLRIRPLPPPASERKPSMWADFRAGVGYVRSQTWLWGTLVSAALAYLLFFGPTEVLLPYVVKQLLHGSATELGVVLACGGATAVLTALLIGQTGLPRRFITFMYGTWTIATLAVAGYGLATDTWQLALACAVVNGFETAGIIAWGTAKQRLVPARLLGRVSGVDWFVSISLVPLSYALTAPVAEAIGARRTLVGAGAIGSALTLAFLFLPGMRAVERDPNPHNPHAPGCPQADPTTTAGGTPVNPTLNHPRGPLRNDDVDWDLWPVQDYLAENYRELHACDAQVIRHHSAFYRRLAPGSVSRSLEFGAGPNLYPLMLAAGASRRINAVESSAAGVDYLTRQLIGGPDPSWQTFYTLCRELQPALPTTLVEALSRVHSLHGDIRDVPEGTYDLASMNFVAESVTEDIEEFTTLCRTFIRAVRPGGLLVAAFMENMPRYRIGSGPAWPGCPIDADAVRSVFQPHTDQLHVTRIDTDPTLPDYGDTGMVLLHATRAAHRPEPCRSA
ncbi:MFS transporter [Streptacidiphilus sp. MAP5-3]|uniref:MFS transporter n=1 Tax=unclassified Streptacidiphilus TaxID=2643834 RepID=UPI003514C363